MKREIYGIFINYSYVIATHFGCIPSRLPGHLPDPFDIFQANEPVKVGAYGSRTVRLQFLRWAGRWLAFLPIP